VSYEDAPATKMLATHCAVCARPLVDAESVEKGIGPECRKRHGFNVRVPMEARQAANKLVHRIACGVTFFELASSLTELSLLGFSKLAETIYARRATIKVETLQDTSPVRLLVKSPYTEGSLATIRAIPGRRAEYEGTGENKHFLGNSFPVAERARVWDMLQRHFPGAVGVGPKGAFQVPSSELAPIARVRPTPPPPPTPADELGCPTCGDLDFHDGENCPHKKSA
jgi:hypothetical protein